MNPSPSVNLFNPSRDPTYISRRPSLRMIGMFREITRSQKALPREECLEILRNEKRGVLSLIGDNGYPYGMPLNHFYNDEDGRIYFHSGMEGHKVDSFRKDDKASFCVYDGGYRNEGDWALNIRSVIVFGRIVEIDDKEEIFRISRLLSHKFTLDDGYIEDEIRKHGHRTLMFALVPEHMTGKIVKES